jgi:hypothetical protein
MWSAIVPPILTFCKRNKEFYAEKDVIRTRLGTLMANDVKVIWGYQHTCHLVLKITADCLQPLRIAVPPLGK